MKRTRSTHGAEKPSIIKEIVIYDKPNKPLVPHEIFPQRKCFTLGKGDIILSRSKDPEDPGPYSQKEVFRNIKSGNVKNEPSDIEEVLEEGTSPRTEILVDVSAGKLCLGNSPELEERTENTSIDIQSSTVESVTKTIFTRKTVKKLKLVKPTKKNRFPLGSEDVTTDKESSLESTRDDSAFKKPKSRAKKADFKSEKSTVLNFFLKQPKAELLLMNEGPSEISGDISSENISADEESTPENHEVDVSDTPTGGREKRVRRLPKKFVDAGIIVEDRTLGHYSNQEVAVASPVKKKKYAELTVVSFTEQPAISEFANVSADSLEELPDDAHEQVRYLNDADAEMESRIQGGQLPLEPATSEMTTKKSEKNNKKTSARKNDKQLNKQKDTVPLSVKKEHDEKSQKKAATKKADKNQEKVTVPLPIKKEVEDVVSEEEDSLLELSHEEVFESDGDSRTEWIPEEYAEYKKKYVMKTLTKMHKCKYCCMEFSTYYAVRKHRALEHDDVGTDRKESTFGDDEDESDEVEGHIEGEVESDAESRGEWMPEDYAEYKLKHSLNKLKRNQWYKCKICCEVFSNYYKLSKHRLEHEKSNPYGCKQCGEKFGDVDTLAAHIRVHQGKDPFKCKKCDAGFQTKEELNEHALVHILKKPPPPVKRFRCDLCGKEFGKLCDIERHTRVHTGEKTSECNICHKRFQQAHNLSKHLLTHLHVKPFQCEICNKKFGRIDVLNRHLLTHSIEKPFKCDLCNKGFIRQVQLNNHMEKTHPEIDLSLEMEDVSVTEEVIVRPI